MPSFSMSKKIWLIFGMLAVALILYKMIRSNDQRLYTVRRKPTKTIIRVRPPVDCVRLIKGDEAERRRAEDYQKHHPKKAISDEEYIDMTNDCVNFVETRGYIISPPIEEKNFPLAIAMVIFKDVELFERLLRAVYRPQNVYCVHVDKKADSTLHKAVCEIVGCLDNVFVLQNNVEVSWGGFSVLEAEILCMEALLKYTKWKYFINLTGQEFPLRTNWELVQILKVLNGTNLVGATNKLRNLARFAGRPPPPIDVILTKGPVHIVVSREFVEYAVNDENGQKLLNWSKLVAIPDEVFYSTLNHNPQLGLPGAYLGEPENDPIRYPLISRLKIWEDDKLPCHGKYAREICIFGVGDLPLLAATPHFIANKFHLDYQPLALDCLEELIYNRTQEEMLGNRDFNTSYYENLDVAKNHL